MFHREPSREAGVIRVFNPKRHTVKLRKNSIPIVFLVATKKGTEPILIKYDDLKKDFPNLLFDFFEKKLNIHTFGEDESCLTPQKKERYKTEKESTRDRDELNGKDLREKELREQRQRQKEGQRDRDLREKERMIKEKQREERERETLRILTEKDSRPMRSCRYRKDNFKHNEDFEFQPQPHRPNPQTPSSSVQESIQESQMDSEQQFRTRSQQKILDFDQMLQDMGLFNLVSPAFIPASKSKQDIVSNLNPGTFYPPLPPIKDIIQREYSSEGFKDSEESQFLLDDRGFKDKKRRDRMVREHQERFMMMSRRKKSKKIKKKKRMSGK